MDFCSYHDQSSFTTTISKALKIRKSNFRWPANQSSCFKVVHQNRQEACSKYRTSKTHINRKAQTKGTIAISRQSNS